MRSYKISLPEFNTELIHEEGTSLSTILKEAKIIEDWPCGGRGTCGKCKVLLSMGAKAPLGEELETFSAQDLESGWRLACLHTLTEDMIIETQSHGSLQGMHIVSTGSESFDSWTPKKHEFEMQAVQITMPSYLNPIAFSTLLKKQLGAKITFSQNATLQLSELTGNVCNSSKQECALSLVTTKKEGHLHILNISEEPIRALGGALDLGTTTLVFSLIDLITGQTLSKTTMPNPQKIHGGDLISRISYSLENRENQKELGTQVHLALKSLMTQAIEECEENKQNVFAISIAGNTVMGHLFAGLNTATLSKAPFSPTTVEPLKIDPHQIDLEIHPEGALYLLPNMGGYVGADLLAGSLVCELDKQEGFHLLVDVGTNGEVVAAVDSKLYVASAAAGPCFEGAGISTGMAALPGAVSAIEADNEKGFIVSTIGKNPSPFAKGICGSGVIDLIAFLSRLKIIDETGSFIDEGDLERSSISPTLKKRIHFLEDGAAFHYADGSKGHLYFSQRDVRELQLAKSAIRTAIEIVIDEVNKHHPGAGQPTKIYLAGGFGSHIHLKNGISIGLFPHFPEENYQYLGNTSLEGAKRYLLDSSLREVGNTLSQITNCVETASHPDFQEKFADYMMF